MSDIQPFADFVSLSSDVLIEITSVSKSNELTKSKKPVTSSATVYTNAVSALF